MTEDRPITVLIAEDQIATLTGLNMIIRNAPGFRVVGLAENLDELRELAATSHPDVILLDVIFPGDDRAGLKVIRKLRSISPNSEVIVLSVKQEYVEAAKAMGVLALAKDYDLDELFRTIRWALDPASKPRPAAPQEYDLPPNLTPRERDVLPFIPRGLTDREIGQQLHLAEGTIGHIVGELIAKFQVSNRTELAAHIVLFQRQQGIGSRPPPPASHVS